MKKALSLILIQSLLLNIASAYFLVSPVYGSKASEAGDRAWSECKSKGGTDQECRRAAEDAYNKEASKNPPSPEEKKEDEAADKARVEALKKRAEELQKEGVSKEEAEARASERMIGGCSSSHPYNGRSCTKHPPGGQCPGDYQWCDGGCCRYSGGAPKPAEEPRKKACNDRDIGEVWGECLPGGVWKKVKCVGPQQWEVLDTDPCRAECGCKPEEKKPEPVPISAPKKKACNDRDIGEDWGECHGTTWKHVECIGEQKWKVRETRENSTTCGGQPQEENISPLPAAVEAQTAAGDLGNCSQNCRDSSNRCTQPVGSVSPGPEGKTYVCVANWRNQKVAGWEVAGPGEEKPAPSTFIAAPQPPVYNSKEKELEEQREQRKQAWKWIAAPKPTPTSQVGQGLWGVTPAPTKAPTPIPKPTPTGPHAMTPEELAQTIERFQNPQPGDVIETPTGTRVVVTQPQSGGTFRGRVVDKGHEANFNISDIKAQTPKELVVDTDGDKIPDKVEKMAMEMGYKNLNPERDESKTPFWDVASWGDYKDAKIAVERAGVQGVNPNTWTKEQEKTVERQLNYQKDPLKITQIVALPLPAVGAVGFAYPQWKERGWAREDLIEAQSSSDPRIEHTAAMAKLPPRVPLSGYSEKELGQLIGNAEAAGFEIPAGVSEKEIEAYRSAYDNVSLEHLAAFNKAKIESRRRFTAPPGVKLEPVTKEEIARELGWDSKKMTTVSEAIENIQDFREELVQTPEAQKFLQKEQEFITSQTLSIAFDFAIGPIIGKVASAIGGRIGQIIGKKAGGEVVEEMTEQAVKMADDVAPGGRLTDDAAREVMEKVQEPGEALIGRGVVPADDVAAAATGVREVAEATTTAPETSKFLDFVDDSPLPQRAKNALSDAYYFFAGERGAITISGSPARQNLVKTLKRFRVPASQIDAAQSIFDDHSRLAAKRIAELQAQGVPDNEIIEQVSSEMQKKTAQLIDKIPGRDPKAVWYHLTDALGEETKGLVAEAPGAAKVIIGKQTATIPSPKKAVPGQDVVAVSGRAAGVADGLAEYRGSAGVAQTVAEEMSQITNKAAAMSPKEGERLIKQTAVKLHQETKAVNGATTFVGASVTPDGSGALVVSTGDSIAMQVRPKKPLLRPKGGEIIPGETSLTVNNPSVHGMKNGGVISIGGKASEGTIKEATKVFHVPVQESDRIILFSDGLPKAVAKHLETNDKGKIFQFIADKVGSLSPTQAENWFLKMADSLRKQGFLPDDVAIKILEVGGKPRGMKAPNEKLLFAFGVFDQSGKSQENHSQNSNTQGNIEKKNISGTHNLSLLTNKTLNNQTINVNINPNIITGNLALSRPVTTNGSTIAPNVNWPVTIPISDRTLSWEFVNNDLITDFDTITEKSFMSTFSLARSVYAAEPETLVLSPTAYEIIARKVMVAKAFEGKNVEKMSDEEIIKILEQVVETDLEPKPSVEKVDNQYLLTTDLNGSVSHQIEPGVYTLKVDPIGDLTINAPETINVSVDGGVIEIGLWTKQEELPIYIRIPAKIFDKIFDLFEKLIPGARAQETTSGQLAVNLYYDENNNGTKDPTEIQVEWAGVKIALAKETQEKTYHLSEGWNLVAFPVLPTGVKTASELVADVAKQGGYVTTVAKWENGKWEAFIQRGANQFGSDFSLEPGKGYFLRNHLEIDWVVAGKEMTEPLPLKLEKGYNLIGIISAITYTGESVIDSINTIEAEMARTVTRFESGLYEPLVKQEGMVYGQNFAIEPQRGYFIRVNKEVLWQP